MYRHSLSISYICARCLQARAPHNGPGPSLRRSFAVSTKSPLSITIALHDGDKGHLSAEGESREEGAMSTRLREMSERNLEEGGRSARKAIEEAGFDDEIKQKLLDRIANTSFRGDNQRAFSVSNMPTSADKMAREIASAEPWSGTESVADASLRMLNDAYKPLRQPANIPSTSRPTRPPKKIDTGRPRKAPSSGARLANARDRSSMYSFLRDDNLSKAERDKMRQEMKEKFQPGARSVPATLQGLASLANERIEDAIARGQFKNLPRGKKIERDYNMSSPFLDTTEYFMNKIIQKQDIVPPWIEKQQELVSHATKFRGRLRADWRRHAARLIASRGGSLESQIARAKEYARAEAIVNPVRTKEERLNSVDNHGQVSQISFSGELQNPKDGVSEGLMHITVSEEPGSGGQQDSENSLHSADVPLETGAADARVIDGAVFPFRDPNWEQLERSYHTIAIESLNSITRSYNLMAPNLAKKPYFSLDRELRACFADVAPQLADEIRERATARKVKVDVITHTPGGVLERMGGGSAQVYDSRKPHYGFKEFWKDLFGKDQTV